MANALTFQNTTFSVIDQNGQQWLSASEIAQALGYTRGDAVARLYERNRTEFTEAMVGAVKMTTPGGIQTVRIFSLRGAHLLAMFAKTARAAEFRRWLLDLIEQQNLLPTPTRPSTRLLMTLIDGEVSNTQMVPAGAMLIDPERLDLLEWLVLDKMPAEHIHPLIDALMYRIRARTELLARDGKDFKEPHLDTIYGVEKRGRLGKRGREAIA